MDRSGIRWLVLLKGSKKLWLSLLKAFGKPCAIARPGDHQSKRSESQVITTHATQCSFQAAGFLEASARNQHTSGNSRETAYTSDPEHSYPPPAPARPARDADSPTIYTAFLIVGLVCLVAINVLFIVDIELTLQRNKKHQTDEEREWGFGQILALLLLIVPLRDAWNALRVIRSRPQQQFEVLFKTSAKAASVVEKLGELVTAGADPGKPISGKFANFLQLAAYYGKRDLRADECSRHLLNQQWVSAVSCRPVAEG